MPSVSSFNIVLEGIVNEVNALGGAPPYSRADASSGRIFLWAIYCGTSLVTQP